jgi:hypothetical protein
VKTFSNFEWMVSRGNSPLYHIHQREEKSVLGEGLSDDGCRPAWTKVPPW